jgi:hypothetical protein
VTKQSLKEPKPFFKLMQFKSIPFIATVKQSATTQQVANQLQEMLNTQTADGWTFDTIQTVKPTFRTPVNRKAGIWL